MTRRVIIEIISRLMMKNREKLLFVLVLAGVLAVHSSYINNGFAWLDHGDIENRRAVLPINKLGQAFLQPYGETYFYRPLATVVNSIDYYFYRANPKGFHLTNVLLHVAAVAASFFLSGCFFGLTVKERLLASFIFGTHVLSFLPVGAISYRQELLAVVFTCLTVYFHQRARKRLNLINIVGLAASFSFALLSKETALFWIGGLILFWEILNPAKDKWRKKYVIYLLEAVIFAAYFIIRFQSVGFWKSATLDMLWEQAIGTRLSVLGKYIVILISPWQPALSDAVRVVGLFHLSSLIGMAFLVLGIWTIIKRGWNNRVSRAVVLIFLTLIPSFNILPLPRFSSPHYLYFTSIFYAVLLILVVKKIDRLLPLLKNIIVVGMVSYLLIMAKSTYSAGFHFQNDRTLFEKEVGKEPNFLEGHFYLGYYYFHNQNFTKAKQEYQKALLEDKSIIAYVDRSSTLINLAGVEMMEKEYDRAEKHLLLALKESRPFEQANIIYNLGLIYFNQGKFVQTVELFDKSQIKWHRIEPWILYAEALVIQEKYDRAVEVLKKSQQFLDIENRQKVGRIIEEIKKR